MRIDIGIASYENPERLDSTLNHLRKFTRSDYRILVVDNASPNPNVRKVIEKHAKSEPRVIPLFLEENGGYASAVNEFLLWADSDYLVYCDNDAEINTLGWDLMMAQKLDENPELAMVFPKGVGAGGAYEIQRPNYTEILWGIGCFWMLRREAQEKIGLFDEDLGHQEEVDYQTRTRLHGWKIAIMGDVKIHHHQKSTKNPEAEERIKQGVIRWMNKWVAYFCGSHMNYFSDNVLRFEDWPVNALYMEEWFKERLPGLNDNPEVVVLEGRNYDLCKVPRTAWSPEGGLYRGRII